jgi:hypothetical protein
MEESKETKHSRPADLSDSLAISSSKDPDDSFRFGNGSLVRGDSGDTKRENIL